MRIAVIGMRNVGGVPLREARLVEPLAMTWIVLARLRGHGLDFELDVVRRLVK